MAVDAYDRGHYYVAIGWILTAILLLAVAIRLYSRGRLTRSLGSDDLFIVVAAVSFVVNRG